MKLKPEQIKNLRARHSLTQEELATSLYGIKRGRITDWETGRRSCPPLAVWAMILTWDGLNILEPEDELKWIETYAL